MLGSLVMYLGVVAIIMLILVWGIEVVKQRRQMAYRSPRSLEKARMRETNVANQIWNALHETHSDFLTLASWRNQNELGTTLHLWVRDWKCPGMSTPVYARVKATPGLCTVSFWGEDHYLMSAGTKEEIEKIVSKLQYQIDRIAK